MWVWSILPMGQRPKRSTALTTDLISLPLRGGADQGASGGCAQTAGAWAALQAALGWQAQALRLRSQPWLERAAHQG